MTAADIEKHSARAAEARRRIALTAALDASAATRADGDEAVILAGARAHLWIASGVCRGASERFIADLCHDYDTATVLAAAIALCIEQPPGARTWLRRACQQRVNAASPTK